MSFEKGARHTLILMKGLQMKLHSKDNAMIRELYDTYSHRLLRLAYRITGNENTAEDVLQEAFIAFWKSAKAYREEASAYTYLYRIVTNKSIDAIRAGRRKMSLTQKAAENSKSVEEDKSEEISIRIVLSEALDELEEKFRIPIILLEYERLSYEAISNVLDIPINTVRTRIFRARKMLSSILEERGVQL